MSETIVGENGEDSHLTDFVDERVESFREAGLRSGDILTGLQTLRSKLLDLTKRNRLLNYSHPKASIRFIDEIPELIYRNLAAEEIHRIEGIPEPDPENVSEEQAATLEDLTGHDRAVYVARTFHGLDTSYDLPEHQVEAEPEARHTDSILRALYDPETVEALLRDIAQNANLAIEESGSNFLHLAIGFLEWYDADHSDKAFYAPLLLIPVEMERTLADGRYSFSIKASDELPMANLSLIEKLKQFGLQLPQFDEDTDLKGYLEECTNVIRNMKRWKVRRFMTLGLFQFSKILIFKDLDPDQWPEKQPLDKNDQVRLFFVPQTDTTSGGHAADYEIDEHPQQDVALIEDADSTQHSALIDALAGKNLIIEGPPGTGKSQTITNLIATAMGEGKSVLFVSEKLAALKVVKNRLTDAGLGDFCLELHSEKAKKTELLEAIRHRQETHYQAPQGWERRLAELKGHRKDLQRLVAALKAPCGDTGMTNQRVLIEAARWRMRAKEALGSVPQIFEALRYPTPVEYDWSKREDYRNLLRLLGDYIDRLAVEGHGPKTSPWYGIAVSESIGDEFQIIQGVRDLRAAAERLLGLLGEGAQHFGVTLAPSLRQAKFSGNLIQPFDEIDSSLSLPFLAGIAGPESTTYYTFLARLEESQKTEAELCKKLGTDFDVRGSGPYTISTIEGILAYNLPGRLAVTQIQELAQAAQIGADNVGALIPTLDGISHAFLVPLPPNLAGIQAFESLLAICRLAPLDDLSHRALRIYKSGIRFHLEKAEQAKAAVLQDQAYLELVFFLETLPDRQILAQAALTLGATSTFSFFSSEWRRARKLYRSIRIDKKAKFNPGQACQDLNIALRYLKAKEEIDTDPVLQTELGEQFAGIRTDFGALARVALWFEGILTAFPPAIPGEISPILKRFAEIDAGAVRQVSEMEVSWFGQTMQQLRGAFSQSAGLEERLLAGHDTWEVLAKALAEFSAVLRGIETLPVPVEMTISQLRQLKDQLVTLLRTIEDLDDSSIESALGEHFQGSLTDRAPLQATAELFRKVKRVNAPASILDRVVLPSSPEAWEVDLARLRELALAVTAYEDSVVRFNNFAAADVNQWAGASMDVISAIAKAAIAAANAERALSPYLNLASHIRECQKAGVSRLMTLILDGHLEPKHSDVVLDHCIFGPLAGKIKSRHPSLAQSGAILGRFRAAFATADKDVQLLAREGLAARIAERPIPEGYNAARVGEKTDLALINHLLPQQKPRVTVRALCSRAGGALRALKPCFMMGPLAVAQFLERGAPKFDLVVMDEASQMRPEDALGAIARGKQVVIVGDPKQLPPTNFFDRTDGAAKSDDDTVLHVSDSILEAANGLMPSRLLKWHYRSRHESLIAFSNRYFYDSKLVVFPSPFGDHPDYGVKFNKVAGIYGGSKNEVEAKVIARALLNHLRDRSHESVGVVAMNIQQTKLIEEIFYKLLREEPDVQESLEKKALSERFFIKNLENVQGDERDVIMISITYGPDAAGEVHRRFGPINFTTGWRRLNVLFTRAKFRVEVFGSMTADDIVLDDNAPRGAKALKAYLHYAKTGILKNPDGNDSEDRTFDSPFEEEVAQALRQRGLDCVPQMGVAGYRIDLAVRDPSRPGSYILGLECDGVAYHSCQTSRDRDRLRQQVLERLGWNIHRIWSTDWFLNPEHEIEGVLKRIEALQRARSSL